MLFLERAGRVGCHAVTWDGQAFPAGVWRGGAAWATSAQQPPAPLTAYVPRVVDGDTIHAMLGNRIGTIRYIGIDTPETHHPHLGAQPGGQAASVRAHTRGDGTRLRAYCRGQ